MQRLENSNYNSDNNRGTNRNNETNRKWHRQEERRKETDRKILTKNNIQHICNTNKFGYNNVKDRERLRGV